MNQKLKKVNLKFPQLTIKPWWMFSCILFAVPFSLFIKCWGWILWLQSTVISIFIILTLYWLFHRLLNNTFKGVLLKGYDPWHLKPLLDEISPNTQFLVCDHNIPFFFSFDFYNIKKTILSSSLLVHLKKNEIETLIKFQKNYFDLGWAKFFTQFCFILFILFFPAQYFIFLLQKIKFIRLSRFFEKIFQYGIFIFLYPLTHFLYYKMDQKKAKLLKNQNMYCEWIWKLQSYLKASPLNSPILLSVLYLVNPSPHFLFDFHPPIEKRIKKIIGHFPNQNF